MPLRLPPDVTRISASTRLSIEAEYRGWELTRVRLYTDGSRRVLLRRKKTAADRLDDRRPAGDVGRDLPQRCGGPLFLVPAERIHTWVFAALRAGDRATARCAARWPHGWRRTIRCWPAPCSACDFPAPLGLAAGFDKDGVGLDTWGALGFGYAEVGTVTAQPQPGNPPPRLFRLPDDRALLNRMGFNNHGAGELALRLARHAPDVPIGVNIGKTKARPGRARRRRLPAQAPGWWLRWRRSGGQRQLAEHARAARPAGGRVAAPDPGRGAGRDVHAGAGQDRAGPVRRRRRRRSPTWPSTSGLAGIVATNTTVSRDGLATAGVDELGAGGVSGPPVARRSLEVLRRLYGAGR